jgi:hypothetical protein
MAHRIIKTPNGKYAAFSDPVDHFVMYNATREEAVQYCVDEYDLGPKGSEEKVKRADEDKTWDGGTGRYEEAMSTILHIHGAEEVAKYRLLLEGYTA